MRNQDQSIVYKRDLIEGIVTTDIRLEASESGKDLCRLRITGFMYSSDTSGRNIYRKVKNLPVMAFDRAARILMEGFVRGDLVRFRGRTIKKFNTPVFLAFYSAA